jgi:predicted nucleic acid-binding protein
VIAYVDSSVILRLILAEPHPLREWPDVRQGVTSALAEVEVLRTLDRLRFSVPTLDPKVLAGRREAAFRVLEGLETVEITRSVLARAAQPLPVPLGTLDAVHLVSAMGWREQFENLVFATHDLALSAAARASGFEVIGAPASTG